MWVERTLNVALKIPWLFLGWNLTKLLLCLTSALSICQNVIFLGKKALLNVGPKLSYLGIFGLELEKTTVLWYFTLAPSNFSKILLKIKILKFRTKTALIEYFGLEFQNTNVAFEISILEFVNMESFI